MKTVSEIGLGFTGNENDFLNEMRKAITLENKLNKRTIEKIAKEYGIKNQNYIKELTELAIVQVVRKIASGKEGLREKYNSIVKVYQNQANLSHRTSRSMMLQQYSTPAPISYLASQYIFSKKDGLYFEPSAGNGLLTVAIPYNQCEVNEVDDIRLSNLKSQPFAKITNQDASRPFYGRENRYDGIITNPPFGTAEKAENFGIWSIKTLEHIMAIRALETMKDNGKAAIIIGGHTTWDNRGRIQAGKNRLFFNYLYHHYNVEDVILIDGHKLYSRQGTAFNTRLILIDGRKEVPEGVAPLKTDLAATVVSSFDELWVRFGYEAENYQNDLINAMIKKAIPFRSIGFSDEVISQEFGMDMQTGKAGILKTPIGLVEVLPWQIKKLEKKSRIKFTGLINPTLQNPLVISKSIDAKGREREAFIKTFYDKANNKVFMVCFIKNEEGTFEMVSGHPRRVKQIERILSRGNITYINDSITALLGFTDSPKPNYTTLIIGVSLKFLYKDKKKINQEGKDLNLIKLKLKLQKAKLKLTNIN